MKAVIFDCFGVLTIDSWTAYVANFDEPLQVEIAPLVEAYDKGILAEERFFDEVADLSGRKRKEIVQAMEPRPVKNRELLQYARELKRSGSRVGLLSNINDDWITEEFLNTEEAAVFDAIVASHHIGCTKPEIAAFVAIADLLRIAPADCIMVDDSERNCRGAELAGMRSVLHISNTDTIAKIARFIQSG